MTYEKFWKSGKRMLADRYSPPQAEPSLRKAGIVHSSCDNVGMRLPAR